MKRRGKVCRALHVRGRWGEFISSPHPTETVGTYETAYCSIRGIIMETKEKEQKDEKKSDTTPEPLKAIASAPAVQAVECSSVVRGGGKTLAAFFAQFTNGLGMGMSSGAPCLKHLHSSFPFSSV